MVSRCCLYVKSELRRRSKQESCLVLAIGIEEYSLNCSAQEGSIEEVETCTCTELCVRVYQEAICMSGEEATLFLKRRKVASCCSSLQLVTGRARIYT